MVEESNSKVGAQLTQHVWNQLQLVIVDPYGRVLGSLSSSGFRKTLIDALVSSPPVPVICRWCNDIVVERPQGVVGKSFVVLFNFLLRESNGNEERSIGIERL